MGKIWTSLKDFAKGLGRHWVWFLVFLIFVAPMLIGVVMPLYTKVKATITGKAA
jgi:hypothetical protein